MLREGLPDLIDGVDAICRRQLTELRKQLPGLSYKMFHSTLFRFMRSMYVS